MHSCGAHIALDRGLFWVKALGMWVSKANNMLPGSSWNSLAQPMHIWQRNKLGGEMEHLRHLACTEFWDGELGGMRNRVGADPAKKILKPSGFFDDSCPRIIMEDPLGYYSHSTDEENEVLINEVSCLYL